MSEEEKLVEESNNMVVEMLKITNKKPFIVVWDAIARLIPIVIKNAVFLDFIDKSKQENTIDSILRSAKIYLGSIHLEKENIH